MDSAHVSYLICNLPKNFFEDFNCDKSMRYGVNMKSLIKIFNVTKIHVGLTMIFNDDTIEFYVNSDNINKVYRNHQYSNHSI